MRHKFDVAIFVILSLFALNVNAYSENDQEYFTTSNPFELTLSWDFALFEEHLNDSVFLPASIHYKLESGEVETKKVKVKAEPKKPDEEVEFKTSKEKTSAW